MTSDRLYLFLGVWLAAVRTLIQELASFYSIGFAAMLGAAVAALAWGTFELRE